MGTWKPTNWMPTWRKHLPVQMCPCSSHLCLKIATAPPPVTWMLRWKAFAPSEEGACGEGGRLFRSIHPRCVVKAWPYVPCLVWLQELVQQLRPTGWAKQRQCGQSKRQCVQGHMYRREEFKHVDIGSNGSK